MHTTFEIFAKTKPCGGNTVNPVLAAGEPVGFQELIRNHQATWENSFSPFQVLWEENFTNFLDNVSLLLYNRE
jgi:hypothetical protein